MAEVAAYPTNGGNGAYSYSQNSSFQRNAIEVVKDLINKGIEENVGMNISSSSTYRIVDLGCSVGPNTFLAVQNIIDAVELKYQNQSKSVPEFQVFFNDHALNDFNKLFTSLPSKKRYYAAGMPGSFHQRLFPVGTIDFVHSSYAVQCMSRVPKEVVDKNSVAWNKGRVHYSNSTAQVIKSYEDQYVNDMEGFLNARAQEIVVGGLMALIVPGRPNGTPHSQVYVNKTIQIFESSLLDLVNKGTISEEKLDTFNLPQYFVSSEEIEALVKRNGCFSIANMESLPQQIPQPKVMSSTVRAGMEGMIKGHFGEEILEELFDIYSTKLEASFSQFDPEKAINLFVLLKRIATC